MEKVKVVVTDDNEKWSFGEIEKNSAEELAEAILELVKYECGGSDGYRVGDSPEYVNYEVCAFLRELDGELIAKEDAWMYCGYVAPGASQDINGMGLTLWGSAQHGEWSEWCSDGQGDGRDGIVRAVWSWMEKIGVVVEGDEAENWIKEWKSSVKELDWVGESMSIPIPDDIREPYEEEIADCCEDVLVSDGDGKRVAVGHCMGTPCAARWNRDGKLEEAFVHASRGDVQRLIENCAEELSKSAREISAECWRD